MSVDKAKYRLVEFIGSKTKEKKEIDIVPSTWIYHDQVSDVLKCKFMPENQYTDKNLKILLEMVKNCKEPRKDWPSYPVEIRGRAHSYDEAEKLIDKLHYQSFVYSTDNEVSAKKKAREDENFFKQKEQSPSTALAMLNSASKPLNSDSEEEPNAKSVDVHTRKRTRAKAKKSLSSENSSPVGTSNDEQRKKKFKKVTEKNKNKSLSSESSSPVGTSNDESIKKFKKVFEKNKNKTKEPEEKANSQDILWHHHPWTDHERETHNTRKNFYVNDELLTNIINKIMSPLIQEQKNNNVQLKSLIKSVNDLKGCVIDTKKACELNSSATTSLILLDADYDCGIDLPCQKLADFVKFETKLKEENFRKIIVRKLLTQVNTNQAMVKSVGAMMRLIMSREVALLYNLKKTNDLKKKLFIETELYKILKGILMQKFSKSESDPLPESQVTSTISSVLSHCGDWEGGRTNRKKMSAQKKTEKDEAHRKDEENNNNQINETEEDNGHTEN